jgi:cellobiose-specific phosphotransferase system component IIB
MKKERVISFAVCFLTLCMVTSVFASEIEEQGAIEDISSEIEAVSTSMAEDIQTSTAALDGTVWQVDVISIPPTVTTTATLTFSNGMLTITDWLVNLGPEVYTETPQGNKTSFSAMFAKKIFSQYVTYEIKGSAKLEKKIAGLIHNTTWDMYCIFFGEPLPASEE